MRGETNARSSHTSPNFYVFDSVATKSSEDLKSLHPFMVKYFNHQHHFGAPGDCMNMSASL